MRIIKEIKGKEVVDSSGIIVGKVKDFQINWEQNELEAMVIGKGGITEILGLSGNEVLIPCEEVKQIGDKILLK